MIEIRCDYSGEVLARDGENLRPYLTLRNNLVYQKASPDDDGVRHEYLPERDKVYNFRDATALADWVDDEIERRGLDPLEAND